MLALTLLWLPDSEVSVNKDRAGSSPGSESRVCYKLSGDSGQVTFINQYGMSNFCHKPEFGKHGLQVDLQCSCDP